MICLSEKRATSSFFSSFSFLIRQTGYCLDISEGDTSRRGKQVYLIFSQDEIEIETGVNNEICTSSKKLFQIGMGFPGFKRADMILYIFDGFRRPKLGDKGVVFLDFSIQNR